MKILPQDERWQRVSNVPQAFSLALKASFLQALHLISITVTSLLIEGRADLSRMKEITLSSESRIP